MFHPPAVRRHVAFAGLALLIGLAGAPVAAQGGAETPEALFAAVRDALAAGDVAGVLTHVVPSQRKGAALMMFVGASFAIAFDDNAEMLDKGLDQIIAKHGLDALLDDDAAPGLDADEDAVQRAGEELFAGKDEVAFIRDLFGFLEDNEVMKGRQQVDPATPLTDLKVEGDRATATWGDEPIVMVREGGRWYIDQTFGS